jgi:cell division protein FtsB
MNFRSLVQTKTARLLILGLTISILVLGNMNFQQWKKKKQIAQEIQALVEQQQNLEQKNKDLSESLTYLTSGNYKERIARQQLNLKKEGEIVYNFNEPIERDVAQTQENVDNFSDHVKSWWLYFFKP